MARKWHRSFMVALLIAGKQASGDRCGYIQWARGGNLTARREWGEEDPWQDQACDNCTLVSPLCSPSQDQMRDSCAESACSLDTNDVGQLTIPYQEGAASDCVADPRAGWSQGWHSQTLDADNASLNCPHQDLYANFNGLYTAGDWLFCPGLNRFGFHPDTVCAFRHAWRSLPWGAMPASNSAKAVVMFAVFGFDLKMVMKEFVEPTLMVRAMDFGKTLPLLLLVLMGWWSDFHQEMPPRFFEHTSGVSPNSISGYFLGRFAMRWASSPNFVAAMAFWSSTVLQCPSCVLHLQPKYKTMFGSVVGFPRYPTGARWLSPWKWLYGMLLWPYMAPLIAGGWVWRRIKSSLQVKVAAVLLMIVLLADCVVELLWHRRDFSMFVGVPDGFGGRLFALRSFAYALALWTWSAFVPCFFARAYGFFIKASQEDICKVGLTSGGMLKTVRDTLFPYFSNSVEGKKPIPMLPYSLEIDPDDIEKLRYFNREMLEVDFVAEALEEEKEAPLLVKASSNRLCRHDTFSPSAEALASVDGKDNGLRDTRMLIVFGTLKRVGVVMRVQMGSLIIFRFLTYFRVLALLPNQTGRRCQPFTALVMAVHFSGAERTMQAFVDGHMQEMSFSGLLNFALKFWNTS